LNGKTEMKRSQSLNSLLWFAAVTCIGLIAAPIFIFAPTIDIEAARFFTGEDGFPLSRHPLAVQLNRLIVRMSETGIFFILFGLVVTLIWRRTFLGLSQQHFWFFILSVLVAPILVVNAVLKSYWGRARPYQIAEFGGGQDFSPAFFLTDQCDTNCSFVSGDVSAVFSLIALAIVIRWRQKLWVLLVIIFGFIISFTRMAQGGHFLSDTLYAGIITTALILLLKYLVLDSRIAFGPALERSANFIVDQIAILATRIYLALGGGKSAKLSFADARLDRRLRLRMDGWLQDFGIANLKPEASAANTAFLQGSWRHKLWIFFQEGTDYLKDTQTTSNDSPSAEHSEDKGSDDGAQRAVDR
jgi:lipid A 4'-phosphatase